VVSDLKKKKKIFLKNENDILVQELFEGETQEKIKLK